VKFYGDLNGWIWEEGIFEKLYEKTLNEMS
jgi:hypothetical protein